MKKIIRNIRIYFLLREVRRRGVYRWGHKDGGVAFHRPHEFINNWQERTLLALIRMGKLRPNGETHSIPHSRELKEYDYKTVYS